MTSCKSTNHKKTSYHCSINCYLIVNSITSYHSFLIVMICFYSRILSDTYARRNLSRISLMTMKTVFHSKVPVWQLQVSIRRKLTVQRTSLFSLQRIAYCWIKIMEEMVNSSWWYANDRMRLHVNWLPWSDTLGFSFGMSESNNPTTQDLS